MRLLISVILPFLFLFQDCFAADSGLSHSSKGLAGKPVQLYALPWNSGGSMHYVKKDTAVTMQTHYPVWQKKVQPVKTNYFSLTVFSSPRQLLKPGLIFSTIAFNWTSFYLNRQADDFYKNYQRTSDISRMNHYYKKAALYDDLAAAVLGLAATSLSAFLYVLWTE